MIHRLATMAWLLLVFLALNGSATWGALAVGTILAIVVRLLFYSAAPVRGIHTVRPVWVLWLGASFVGQLVAASVHVALAVLDPRRSTARPGIVAVPVVRAPDTVLAALAGFICLTPGTLVVDTAVEPPVFHVHVLEFRSETQTRLDVLSIQRLLLKAFGEPDAIDAVEERIATYRAALAPGDPRRSLP